MLSGGFHRTSMSAATFRACRCFLRARRGQSDNIVRVSRASIGSVATSRRVSRRVTREQELDSSFLGKKFSPVSQLSVAVSVHVRGNRSLGTHSRLDSRTFHVTLSPWQNPLA